MKRLNLARYTLSIGAAAALLAACGGGSQLPTAAPVGLPQGPALATPSHSARYKVLHSFGYGSDGVYPEASLIDVGGTLYGTTYMGGKHNGGTVFSITPRGVEKVLHNFGSGSDGANPSAGLIDVGGTLYGTTVQGGSNICYSGSSSSGCGTVFSITPSGKEKVLHSFSGSSRGGDGRSPAAPLINVNGTLYGTTTEGGAYNTYYGGGTVFAITKSGTESVLYTFKGGAGDGANPQAGLLNVKGTLYGTTQWGGEYGVYDGGTVFSITLSGAEKVLHSFGGASDGDYPIASLINVKGTLYGTTALGGATGCRVFGSSCGTVFSITPGGIGTEKVLHSFLRKTDGGNPFAPLIDVKGTLYGTTWAGGDYYCNVGGNNGCGSVYRISTTGAEKVQYRFSGGSDGAHPNATLVDVDGVLYGTTELGGGGGCFGLGCGTVFALTP